MSEWSHRRGIHLLCYLDKIIAESIPCLLELRKYLFCLCKDLEIVINWEKLDLEPTHKAQYLGMRMDIIQERIVLTDLWIGRFQDVLDKFFHSPPPSLCQMVVTGVSFQVPPP